MERGTQGSPSFLAFPCHVPARIGHRSRQGNVPAGQRQSIHLLTFMGQADQRRFVTIFAPRQVGQAAVVEAAAHAQAPALFVEPHQRQQYQVQRPGLALAAGVGQRFADAEAVAGPAFAAATRWNTMRVRGQGASTGR